MRAHIVLRVSTQRQADTGVSISRGDDQGFQEQQCRKFCDIKQWDVAGVYVDAGVTGRSTGAKRRTGLNAAMKAACEDKGVLLVYAISRLGRTTSFVHAMADRLEAAGAGLASATEPIDTSTAMGKAFLGLCAVFAELESNQNSERVKAARSYQYQKHGHYVSGRRKMGEMLDANKNLVECPEELEVLRRAREAYVQAGWGMGRWKRALNILKASGTPTIHVLRAKRYGRILHRGETWTLDMLREISIKQKWFKPRKDKMGRGLLELANK